MNPSKCHSHLLLVLQQTVHSDTNLATLGHWVLQLLPDCQHAVVKVRRNLWGLLPWSGCTWYHQGFAQSNVWQDTSKFTFARPYVSAECLCPSTVYLRVPKHISVHFFLFRILQPWLHLQTSHHSCFGRRVLITKWFDPAQRLAALTEIRGKQREGNPVL